MQTHRPDQLLYRLSLDDYLSWLGAERDKGRSDGALAKQVSHLRGLLDYSWRSGRTDRNVLDGFTMKDRVRRKVPKTLTLEQARNLVLCCESQTALQRRNRLVILILYGCGLRTSELRGLDIQDVNIERQELFIKNGKGERQRTIPFPGGVYKDLLAYLVERGGKRGPLFRTEGPA